jgi:hypothetical protein
MPLKAAWIRTWLVLSTLMTLKKGVPSRDEEDGNEGIVCSSVDNEDASKDEGSKES